MTIHVQYPGCDRIWPATEALAGRIVRCPACREYMAVPSECIQSASVDSDRLPISQQNGEDGLVICAPDGPPRIATAHTLARRFPLLVFVVLILLCVLGSGWWIAHNIVGWSPGGDYYPGQEQEYHLGVHQGVVLTLPYTHANSVAYSPDGQRVVAGGLDCPVTVWDTKNGKKLLCIDEHWVESVSFSPDGQQLASGGGNLHDPGRVIIWDAQTGQELFNLRGHSRGVRSVAFSPDGQRLASGGHDKTVKVWDTRTGKEVMTLPAQQDQIMCVAYSPDGQRVASAGASFDKTVKVWDIRTGLAVLTLRGSGSRAFTSVAFSPDGQRIATASDDRMVQVWDAQNGNEVLKLQGSSHEIRSVAFSPNGQFLAGCGGHYRNQVTMWDAQTGQATLTLQAHVRGVMGVAFSPDSEHLVAAGYFRTVKIWNLKSAREASVR